MDQLKILLTGVELWSRQLGILAKMTAKPAEICSSLTGCIMYSQHTVGDAHGYKILAFQAIMAAKSSR